ncbi:MAG TPA: hypothetical protein DEO88_16195, partial [Syntrophobacteraceae bacterium]|nr:hypothetical protein [Syntrophobacteraceae bacterium]
GCGLGDDALRMAELVGPNGLVVGVDTSARMIEEALGCAVADRIYNLRQTAKRAEDAGRLLPAVADEWVLEAQTLSRSGGFVCTLTAHTVVGIKPADSMKP